jgi:hypothetical protein
MHELKDFFGSNMVSFTHALSLSAPLCGACETLSWVMASATVGTEAEVQNFAASLLGKRVKWRDGGASSGESGSRVPYFDTQETNDQRFEVISDGSKMT